MKKTRAKTATQRSVPRGRARPKAKKAKSRRPAPRPLSEVVVETMPEPALPFEEIRSPEPEIAASEPEREFLARMVPLEPDRPFPAARRAIFFDVENTSRAEHIARVIDHLAVDRMGRRTDFVAVGNWKVIGLDTGRLLARHGAQLLHSAPSTGVRDWSDLRIAVGAGVWLASARPGDIIEIVTNDRAFDAVGDVAASLGIAFRRLTYQGLVGATAGPAPAPAPEPAPRPAASDSRGRHRRRGRRRGWHETAPVAAPAPAREVVAPAPPPPPAAVVGELPLPSVGGNGAEPPSGEPHTAPHDEIVAIVRELIQRSPARSVTIDTLANALKTRGFSRPPGSPRLITRLRRIKEISVSRSGMITLVEPGSSAARAESPLPIEQEPVPVPVSAPASVAPSVGIDEDFDADDSIGNIREGPEAPPSPAQHRRWPRRGGRNRRPRAQNAPAA